MLEVKFKKLVPEAKIPAYAKPGDAGLDLTATSKHWSDDFKCWVYGTGFAIEIPEGYVGLVFPRSSNRKTNAYMTNHVGVIDSGYRGEIILTYKNRTSNNTFADKPYSVGDRVGQIIILPYPEILFVEVTELSETERGEGGHGSTGN